MSTRTFSYHPEYLINRKDWEKWDALHSGSMKVLYSLLIKMPSETNELDGDALYKLRQSLSFYENKVESIVKKWVENIFENQLTIEQNYKDLSSPFLSQVSGVNSNKTLESFLITDFVPKALIFGTCSILVDNHANFASFEDDQNKTPWLQVVSPLDLVDWETDESGSYTRVEVKTAKPYVKPGTENVLYKFYRNVYTLTPTGVEFQRWEKLDDSSKEEYTPTGEASVLRLSRIPVHTITTDSWVKQLATQCIHLWNLDSQLAVTLAQHGKPWRWIKLNTSDKKAVINASSFGMIALQSGEEVGEIAATDPTALKHKISQVEQYIQSVAMSREYTRPSDSRAVQSAEGMAADMRGIRLSTQTYLSSLAPYLSEVLKTVLAYRSQEWTEEKPIVSFVETVAPGVDDVVQLAAVAQLIGEKYANTATFQEEKVRRSLGSESIKFAPELIERIIDEAG